MPCAPLRLRARRRSGRSRRRGHDPDDAPDPAQRQPQRLEPSGRGGGVARGLRCAHDHLARRGSEERPHRRPHRQHRALRRAWPCRMPGASRGRRSQRAIARRYRTRARASDRCGGAAARGRPHSRRRTLSQRLGRDRARLAHEFRDRQRHRCRAGLRQPTQEQALTELRGVFPNRAVVGIDSRGCSAAARPAAARSTASPSRSRSDGQAPDDRGGDPDRVRP